MSDETEPTEINEPDDTETAAAALTAAGDTEGALKLRLARAEASLKREREARKTIELGAYKSDLVKEFEYADPELIAGASKQAMRASAERLHNAVATVIERKGLKPAAAAAATETPEQETARKKTEWGAPPPVATEAVSGEAPMDWSDLQRASLTGKGPDGQPMDRAAVLKELAQNGARVIPRQTIAQVVRGRAEAAPKA